MENFLCFTPNLVLVFQMTKNGLKHIKASELTNVIFF